MTTRVEVEALCKAALDEETHWRDGSAHDRKIAYERFQHLVRAIADLTDRTYEDVMNDAIEEWITVHFCATPSPAEPAEEWEAAGRAEAATT